MQIDDGQKLMAINEAIWLRDNAERLDKNRLIEIVQEIGEYGIYSARQISNITGNRISHQTVAKLCKKTDRTGGNLNVYSLDDIKECLHSRVRGRTNYNAVRSVVESGTSQGMLAKLSGVNQARISKACNESVR